MEANILILIIAQSLLLLIITGVLLYNLEHISKLKKTEEQKAAYDARQRDFMPMLVHELRAPLSVIQGASDLLLKSASELSSDQIHTLLSQIRGSSGGLLQMVGDILDVSKLEAGRFEINRVFGNLNDVLKEETSYFDSLAKIKNIKLNMNFDKNISNFSFDPVRIKQVMNNLLSNAIKYTPEGGSIDVVSTKGGNVVNISVVDTGMGIPDGDKIHLFHKFAQAPNHNGIKEKGTGLGLVIAKGIVEAHGGKIWIEDNKPHGSKFIFTIPLS